MSFFDVTCRSEDSKARLGVIHLPHGDLHTPCFMPVGTNGTVKGIYHEKIEEMGYEIILANTYHLYLRPGTEVLDEYGSLHEFSSWNRNILTDSGGFQVFSLSGLRKITDEGVAFQSHIDGSRHFFSPEKVVDIQKSIGSDIAMCLDVCTPPGISHEEAKKSMDLTHLWSRRSLEGRKRLGESFRGNLFGIVQGNFYEDLRRESALAISEMDFPGVAIGGLSVGETKSEFSDMLAFTANCVTLEKPRYVMGIGSPDYIFSCVENGIDMFDCVLATRIARNGAVFTDDGLLTLKKAENKFNKGPISEGCRCEACRRYSVGYLHHLVRTNEMLGAMLATEHNLRYLSDLMNRIRSSIRENRFMSFKREYLERYYSAKKDE